MPNSGGAGVGQGKPMSKSEVGTESSVAKAEWAGEGQR